LITNKVISGLPSLRGRLPSSTEAVAVAIPVVPLVEAVKPKGISVRAFAIQDPPVYPESAPMNRMDGMALSYIYGMSAYQDISKNSEIYAGRETTISIYA
jgi:hypothetical protein